MKKKKIIPLLLCSSLLFSCSSNDDENKQEIENKPIEELYKMAQIYIKQGEMHKANDVLSTIDTRFPFGDYSEQVQLDLIYVNYKIGEGSIAISRIDRFIRNNPTHKDLDYLYYIRGLINMQLDDNIFLEFFDIDTFERDSDFPQKAFDDFNFILKNYPASKYAPDAKYRMEFLKSNFARKELKIAEYYFIKKAYVASLNRCKKIIENFPSAMQMENVLKLMAKNYDKLGMTTQKTEIENILQTNSFPQQKQEEQENKTEQTMLDNIVNKVKNIFGSEDETTNN